MIESISLFSLIAICKQMKRTSAFPFFNYRSSIIEIYCHRFFAFCIFNCFVYSTEARPFDCFLGAYSFFFHLTENFARSAAASMNIDDRKGRFIFSILIRTRDSPFFIRYQRRITSALPFSSRPSAFTFPFILFFCFIFPFQAGRRVCSVKDCLFKVSLSLTI